MPTWSDKGKWKEIDPDLPETDPDLTETDPDLTQSDPDPIDADDYAAYYEDQPGPSGVFYCTECCEPSGDRASPLCRSCETYQDWRRRIDRERHNKANREAREAGLCGHCRKSKAEPGKASCTPCRRKKTESQARRDAERKKMREKEKKSEEKKKEKKTEKSAKEKKAEEKKKKDKKR
ncbi:hypothetical protein CEP51_008847 [Fusarium floridanum]|uniref:Uncharacterized protein n=1 Tax=Fusarium floridanum TaxID=1325733 RepID=A0A428RJL4_9HYPO|nr:hypothetical protein CEP51_008847 [Fusarium floridanum]